MPINLQSHLEKINGLKPEPSGSSRGECPVCEPCHADEQDRIERNRARRRQQG